MSPQEIKDLRISKKMNQAQLGDICGVNKSAISSWESDARKPSKAALKILQQLRDGDLIVSEISDLELKLLDQNVTVGKFKSREDYLTSSLKHLLVHGTFLNLLPSDHDNPHPPPAEG